MQNGLGHLPINRQPDDFRRLQAVQGGLGARPATADRVRLGGGLQAGPFARDVPTPQAARVYLADFLIIAAAIILLSGPSRTFVFDRGLSSSASDYTKN